VIWLANRCQHRPPPVQPITNLHESSSAALISEPPSRYDIRSRCQNLWGRRTRRPFSTKIGAVATSESSVHQGR
jgi:hypothetical protein